MKPQSFALFGLVVACTQSSAALIEYAWAPGLLYDDQLDITWLADADPGGVMNWHDAHAYADAYSTEIGGVVYDQWRLPLVWSFETGPGVADGEMGHLFTDYGITSDTPGPFINLINEDYWYDQEFDMVNGLNFTFDPFFFGTYWNDKNSTEFGPRVMLVFDGTPVPAPGALMITTVAGMLAFTRRR